MKFAFYSGRCISEICLNQITTNSKATHKKTTFSPKYMMNKNLFFLIRKTNNHTTTADARAPRGPTSPPEPYMSRCSSNWEVVGRQWRHDESQTFTYSQTHLTIDHQGFFICLHWRNLFWIKEQYCSAKQKRKMLKTCMYTHSRTHKKIHFKLFDTMCKVAFRKQTHTPLPRLHLPLPLLAAP